MSSTEIWVLHEGGGPILATAIHDGHTLRDEVARNMALNELARLQEEDPYTGLWTGIVEKRVIGLHSRFEVDLNRPRDKAVYRVPEDAWGLHVWHEEPADNVVARSLAQYDAFYAEMDRLFTEMRREYGHFVVFDLHTYNHRRQGPDGPAADPGANPEVNIGTGNLDRSLWGPIVERFVAELHAYDFLGRHLDVRENIKFQGGHFSRWAHERFADSACVWAIEFKKFFMDEWTGTVGDDQKAEFQAIPHALEYTLPGVLEELSKL